MTIPKPLTNPDNYIAYVFFVEAHRARLQGDAHNNEPRVCDETGLGLCTHHRIHRSVRDVLRDVYDEPIYIQRDEPLNDKHKRMYDKLGLQGDTTANREAANAALLQSYTDQRLFGGMSSTGPHPCGVNVGPILLSMGVTTHPLVKYEVPVTRQARTAAKKKKNEEDKALNQTTGTGFYGLYGMYRFEGQVQPMYAKRTGLTSADLQKYWEILTEQLEGALSTTTRGSFTVRRLDAFVRESPRGFASAKKFLGRIKAVSGVEAPTCPEDMRFETSGLDDLPQGITHYQLI